MQRFCSARGVSDMTLHKVLKLIGSECTAFSIRLYRIFYVTDIFR